MGTEQFGRLNMMAMLRTLVDAGVVIAPNNGVPVDGIDGTGAGSFSTGTMIINTVNGDMYANTGTKGSPTWTLVADQATAPINLNGSNVADITNQNSISGIHVLHRFDFNGDTGGIVDVPIVRDTLVIDIWMHLHGASAGTATIYNDAASMAVLSTTGSDGDIVRTTNIVNVNSLLSAGQDLGFEISLASIASGDIFVLGLHDTFL